MTLYLSPTSSPARTIPQNAEYHFMKKLLGDLQDHPQAWAFQRPVNGDEVIDYYDVIKKPMGTYKFSSLTHFADCSFPPGIDFGTMEHKLSTKQYSTLDTFLSDAQLVFDNCRLYNPEDSIYAKNATGVEKYLQEQLVERMKSAQ